MASIKQLLKDAKAALVEERYEDVLKSCYAALGLDSSVLEVHLFLGKAQFMLKHYEAAAKSYARAADLNASIAAPYQGLREVTLASGDQLGLVGALEKLITLTEDRGKKAGYLRELAEAQARLGLHSAAYATTLQLIEGAEGATRDEGVASAADLLWKEYEATGTPHPALEESLDAVLALAAPDPAVLSTAAERRLQCTATPEQLLSVASAIVLPRLASAPRSILLWTLQAAEMLHMQSARNVYSAAALSSILSDPLPSSLPSFAAVLGEFGPKCSAADIVSAATAALVDDSTPSALVFASSALAVAKRSLERGRPALALQILDSAPSPVGLPRALQGPGPGPSPSPSPLGQEMSLARAEALLALGRYAEAEPLFQGAVKARADLAWRLRGLQGVAWGFLMAGNVDAALKVASKAEELLSKGEGVEGPVVSLHRCWISAVRGRQLHLAEGDGNLEAAQDQYSTSLQEAGAAQGIVSPQLIAQVQLWRAQARTALGGAWTADRSKAFADFKAAAEIEGPCRGDALAGLASVLLAGGDTLRAQKCLERAVQLDPTSESAGILLCSLLRAGAQGAAEEVALLQRVIAASEGTATWAQRRLAATLASRGDHRAATELLWALLRKRPQDPVLWETLGASFYSLRQLQPALKAFSKAAELDPAHAEEVLVYRHLMCGEVCIRLGQIPESEVHFRRALALEPGNAAVQFSLARALHRCAARHLELGAHGTAVRELTEALDLLTRANGSDPTLAPVHKLHGDVLQLLARCSSRSLGGLEHETPDPHAPAFVESHLSALRLQLQWLSDARRAYVKSIFRHPAPCTAVHAFADAAQAAVQEAHLRRAHTSLNEDGADGNRRRARATRLLQRLLHVPAAATCADIWHQLGAAALDPRVKEYALCRALQLDTARANTWITLGQLYEGVGEEAQANKCFEEARCHEAEDGATWEAMGQQMTGRWGETFGRESMSPGGEGPLQARARLLAERSARLDLDEIAISLWGGGGFLANLWRALDAAALGKGSDIASVASAERAADLHPLSPLAHVALGIAWEGAVLADGQDGAAFPLRRAETAYRTARALLQDPGVPGFGDTPLEPVVSEVLLHLGHTPSHVTDRTLALVFVELNLARCLVSRGQFDEALQLYNRLEISHFLPAAFQPSVPSAIPYAALAGAFLGRAACLFAAGRGDEAKAALMHAIGWVAEDALLTAQTLSAAAVLSAGHDLDHALLLMFQLSDHLATHPVSEGLPADQVELMSGAAARAWTAVLEGARRARMLEGPVLALREWIGCPATCKAPAVDGARLYARAQLMALEGNAGQGCSRRIGRAIFACPWAADVRRQAVQAALRGCPSRVGSILPAKDLDPTPETFAGELITRALGGGRGRGRAQLADLVHRAASAVVGRPTSLQWRVLHAWALLQVARAADPAASLACWAKCHAAVSAALHLAQALRLLGAALDQVQTLVLLLAASSECLMHTRADDPAESAQLAAQAASLASRVRDPAASAIAFLQQGRCALKQGNEEEAIASYTVVCELPAPWCWMGALQAASDLASVSRAAAALPLLELASRGEAHDQQTDAAVSSIALQLVNCELLRLATPEGGAMGGLYLEGVVGALKSADLSPKSQKMLDIATAILISKLAAEVHANPESYEAMGLRSAKELAQNARRLLKAINVLPEGDPLLEQSRTVCAALEELMNQMKGGTAVKRG